MQPIESQAVAADRAPKLHRGEVFGAIHSAISFLLEQGIHWWVSITGKRIRRDDARWLATPLGERGGIGTGIYERLAQAENLQIRTPPDAGLIPDFTILRGPSFNPDAIRSEIRHFYEHTAQYHLEVWTEVSLTGRFFLWLLVEFISRRMAIHRGPIS